VQGQTPRRLSLIDAMVLVAATAPGLALTRSLPEYLGTREQFQINNRIEGNSSGGWGLGTPKAVFTTAGRPLKERASYWLGHAPYWAGPCLLSWSMAAAGLALRGTRPRPRPSPGPPSSAAGLAVAVALAVQLGRVFQYQSASGMPMSNLMKYPEAYWGYFWISLPRLAGYSVAVAWLSLAWTGRWSAESGAIGNLGRALGWCWIAMAVSSEVGMWCFALNH
jgi:hypothetical protein